MDENIMKNIKVEKVTLNIGCGDDNDKIEKAVKLLEILTGKKPVITKSKRRSTFGIPKGKPLATMVTLRGEEAVEFLKRTLAAIENKLKSSQFDKLGNFSFGIKEYIDIPGVRYSHDVGILGFDISVTVQRPGYRIKERRIQKKKISAKHRVNKEEAIEWMKKTFGVEISE
jgi:large subunit ribosomal protein L5